jgi:hypothetical protein
LITTPLARAGHLHGDLADKPTYEPDDGPVCRTHRRFSDGPTLICDKPHRRIFPAPDRDALDWLYRLAISARHSRSPSSALGLSALLCPNHRIFRIPIDVWVGRLALACLLVFPDSKNPQIRLLNRFWKVEDQAIQMDQVKISPQLYNCQVKRNSHSRCAIATVNLPDHEDTEVFLGLPARHSLGCPSSLM